MAEVGQRLEQSSATTQVPRVYSTRMLMRLGQSMSATPSVLTATEGAASAVLDQPQYADTAMRDPQDDVFSDIAQRAAMSEHQQHDPRLDDFAYHNTRPHHHSLHADSEQLREAQEDARVFTAAARARFRQHLPPTHPHPEIKLTRHDDGDLVRYDLDISRHSTDLGQQRWCQRNVIRFNWCNARRNGSLRGSAWRSVEVDPANVGILGIERLDAIVGFEIEVAVARGCILETLGQEIWAVWCGSGEERTVYEVEEEEEVVVRGYPRSPWWMEEMLNRELCVGFELRMGGADGSAVYTAV
ncbi:hypothetical protein BAUCODRAFT_375617 [Baudoinia panamericana UAMH 10762]|uniref:Uncharacterized protein n=1 Tax=Baudoinia panamericana (strain UAMH 10762) TaxID=717646 RepID=M2N3Q4_BAUPA|nr:uncharacterized protein BAUCODRAFT_375617 [Baudoinia panamericana UAMH 10762]EMC98608.1 hypothetical protein BAUCODRAFT_375617 [Baudoinia panamericana UAMH 10762]